MKIIKYKKLTGNRYKLELENKESIILYEEVILNNNLLLTRQIDNIEELNNQNMFYLIYYESINSLKTKYKSINNLKEILYRKYPHIIVDKVIEELINQNYLNDINYTKSYISYQINCSLDGPYKIRRHLTNDGIDDNIINNEITIFDKELEKDRINKLINKQIKSNKSNYGIILKNKINNYLVNMGYTTSIINNEINKYNYNISNNLYKKEYDKLKNKYSKKYNGSELEYKIKSALYRKGIYNEN